MRTKKGQVTIQFNWIYIAVVGAIILILFFAIIQGIRKNANQSLAYDAMTYFDEIFTSMHESDNTEYSITLGGLELEVNANKDSCDFYSIKGSGLEGKSVKYVPLFSPDIVKDRLLSYSLGWDTPFRTSHFLYITSPEIAYVFSGADDLYDALPDNLNKKKDSISGYTNQNYYKVRFISDTDCSSESVSPSVRRVDDNSVTCLTIGSETVEYFVKDGSSFVSIGSVPYYDTPMLVAAVYADSPGAYDCNMLKAVERLNRVSDILTQRVEKIQGAELFPMCKGMEEYGAAKSDLLSISSITKSIIDSRDINKLSTIKNSVDSLKSTNDQINRRSCPTVY